MAFDKPHHFFLSISAIFLLLIAFVNSQSLSLSESSDLISDGIYNQETSPHLIVDSLSLNPAYAVEETCEQTYGFMPCSTTALGNLFLIIVYGYIMFRAATYLSTGSERLLEIWRPGNVGGLVLPKLGALPDAMLILASGLFGSSETAQSKVSVGMGMLAGSTVTILTIIWGTCVVVGKCDIQETNSLAVDGKDTKGFNLTGSGVSTDLWTCYVARMMAISVTPFIVVQLAQLLNSTSGRHLAVLIGLVISLSLLISYCIYQVFRPWIQERQLKYKKLILVISRILKHLTMQPLGRFLTANGEPNRDVITGLFNALDENKDGFLSCGELKALIVGIRFDEIDFDHDDAVAEVMTYFDTSGNNLIGEPEFFHGISKWLNEEKQAGVLVEDNGSQTFKDINNFHVQTTKEHVLLGKAFKRVKDQGNEGVARAKWTSIKPVLLLLLGTIVAAALAHPLVDAIYNFSDATSIPAFFISFIVLPLATSREAVWAIKSAGQKKMETSSLTFSELYMTVTMKNVICLSVFLALVYIRGLSWDFTSEVLAIVVVCILIGGFASFRTTFPLWTSLLAYFLYPFSLALVYVLDYVFGWS